MPKAKQICSTSKCTNPSIRDGKCKAHGRKPWANVSKRNQERPGNWDSLKKAVRARDRGVCYICGKSGAYVIDHIVEVAYGGSWNLGNLASIHTDCHKRKTLRSIQQARKRMR